MIRELLEDRSLKILSGQHPLQEAYWAGGHLASPGFLGTPFVELSGLL